MTSLRQIESNRLNALKSTGPKSDSGKQRSSANAVRHGLSAETVLFPIEDPDDYQAFEQAVIADYEAETAVERELVLRLASLLWRLRRATSIETALLQIQHETPPDPGPTPPTELSQGCTASVFRRGQPISVRSDDEGSENRNDSEGGPGPKKTSSALDCTLDVARRFVRLADLDNGVFERLGRYEAALWRQVRQTLFTLEGLRWRISSGHRRTYHSWQRKMASPPEADW